MAVFPQAYMLRWILSWCSRHGRNPEEFYEREFLANPRPWRLLCSYEAWQSGQDAKAMKVPAPSGGGPVFRRS